MSKEIKEERVIFSKKYDIAAEREVVVKFFFFYRGRLNFFHRNFKTGSKICEIPPQIE